MRIVTGGGCNEFLQGSKMISRQSSVSMSSRIYYRSSGAAGIPFTWEMLPGEPKQKPANDGHIPTPTPPLSPPPALHSLSLPKPSIQNYVENKESSSLTSKLSLLKLWKKMKKKGSKYSDVEVISMEGLEFERSGEYCSSACSGSSSLSTSPSSSLMTEDHHIRNMARAEKHMSCAPWSIGRMVVACVPGTKRI